jgi:hypothetical protein
VGKQKTVLVASIAALVGFVVGRATSTKDTAEERIELAAPAMKAASAAAPIERTAFASPELDAGGAEGKPAADQFCRSHGFAGASEFTCSSGGAPCRAFDLIVCDGKSR